MYQYREPVSMHLAARLAPDVVSERVGDRCVHYHELSRACRTGRRTTRHCSEASQTMSRHAQERSAPPVQGAMWRDPSGSRLQEVRSRLLGIPQFPLIFPLPPSSGVHSPSVHPPLTQLDSLRPLRLPTVLIASPHLGGISTTLSAYESLLVRGYDIAAVLALRDGYYQNHEFLAGYFAERGVGFWSFDKPHAKRTDVHEETALLGEYMARLEGEGMGEVVGALEGRHRERIERLDSMPRRTLDSVWWPFTQHGMVSEWRRSACRHADLAPPQVNKESQVMVIDSAKGDYFDAYHGKSAQSAGTDVVPEPPKSLLNPLFDGSASWFTCVLVMAWP